MSDDVKDLAVAEECHPLDRAEDAQIRLQAVVDRLWDESVGVVIGAMAFSELPEGTPPDAEPPEKWIQELGREMAQRKHRIAAYAQMNRKNAPMALQMAATVVAGMVKAQAHRDISPQMNVRIVNLPRMELQKFPELKVDE